MAKWKPDGHTSVSPYLLAADPQATIDFLKVALGGVEILMKRRPDGSIQHAEVRIDDSVVMIGGVPAGRACEAHVHVYVPDVDAAYARALEAGGVSVQEPARRGDEDKRGGVSDPSGVTWWLATMGAA